MQARAMRQTRILIADDHAPVRRGVRALLESHPGWSICGESANGREAIEQARSTQPDVILLDVSMPELDGLQATQAILRHDPTAKVIILTMHDSREMAAEAARVGAKQVVVKSEMHDLLIGAIESLDGAAVHLGGRVLGNETHVGALFHSRTERYRALAPFIAEGLMNGEKAIHFIDPPDRAAHLDALLSEHVDLASAEADGTARLVSWHETYLREGRFEQDAMLTLIQKALRDAAGEGFSRTRLVASMEWALLDLPGTAQVIDYELRLNEVLPSFPDVVICVYDLSRFRGDTILGVMESHPLILIDDSLWESPFYRPRHAS